MKAPGAGDRFFAQWPATDLKMVVVLASAAEVGRDEAEDDARPAAPNIGVAVDRLDRQLLVARDRHPDALHDRPPLTVAPFRLGASAVGNIAAIVVGAR